MAISIAEMMATPSKATPPRLAWYGEPGSGKTTLLSQVPGIFAIMTENSLGALRFPHLRVRTWEEFKEALAQFEKQDHQAKWLGIDTADGLWQLMADFVVKGWKNSPRSIGEIAYKAGHEVVHDMFIDLFKRLDEISIKRNVGILIVVHQQTKEFSPPDSESYSVYIPALYQSDKTVKTAEALYNWVDALFYIGRKIGLKETEDGRSIALMQGDYQFYCQGKPGFWAKNRYELPPVMPFPKKGHWSVLIKAIADHIKKTQEEKNAGKENSESSDSAHVN